MKKISILLADDHQLIRHGIQLILNDLGDFEVVLEVSNGRELLDQLQSSGIRPDIALIDINMPVMNGFETMQAMAREYPEIRCIALSVNDDFNSVFRMIDSGAKAYLLKDCTPEEMRNTLLKVKEQGAYYDSFVVDKLMDYHHARNESPGSGISKHQEAITQREQEFIRLCCSEMAYKEIADRMGVSPRTVDGYRESVFSKLNLKTRVGIVLFAIKEGYWEPLAKH